METALFRVPQVVCYHTPLGKFIAFLRRHILKVKYISLVNLIADKEVVRELVADTMTVANIRSELESVLYNKVYREQMMVEYERIIQILGPAGASRQGGTTDGIFIEEINFLRDIFVVSGIMNQNPGVYEI